MNLASELFLSGVGIIFTIVILATIVSKLITLSTGAK